VWRICEAGDVVDVVIISPEPGRQKEIGRQLLELADNPRQVQWVTWPQAGYSVPLELFARFDATFADEESEAEEAAESTPRRRRGRPRKEESTDNNTSEEE
jgi:hypothetical protein